VSNPLITVTNTETFGKDPRDIPKDVLRSECTVLPTIMKTVRAFCVDCAGSKDEARKCVATDCHLWPYRMGWNPFSNRKGNVGNLKR